MHPKGQQQNTITYSRPKVPMNKLGNFGLKLSDYNKNINFEISNLTMSTCLLYTAIEKHNLSGIGKGKYRETSLCRTAWSVFRCPEPFGHDSRVCQAGRQTDGQTFR